MPEFIIKQLPYDLSQHAGLALIGTPESLQRLRGNGKGAVKHAKTTPARAKNQRRSGSTDRNSTT